MRIFAALVVPLVIFSAPRALASSRTPAEATVHALDELANVCAQRRPECPPTLTPTPTVTPSPTATSTPQPADTPTLEPIAPTATPESVCWLTDQVLGDPDDNYIVFDDQGAPVPCPTDTSTEETPIAEPTDTPTPTMTATPRPIPQAAPVAPVSAPAAQAHVVIQTVVVEVTAVPSDTPVPPAGQQPSVTSAPIATSSPTSTVTATATATVTQTPRPIVAASQSTPRASSGRWEWSSFLESAGAVLVAIVLVVVLVTRRRVAVWKSRKETTNAV